MKDSKLIKILKTFSFEEIRSFEKFISSPYFNTVKNYSLFIKELIKFFPDFNNEKLQFENIYKKLYKNKIYNKQVMWNIISGLEKLAEEFLEQVALRKNKFERMELLVSEFGSRKLLKNYLHTLNEMEKLLESNAIGNTYFENNRRLENHKQVYYFIMNKVQSMTDSKLKASEYQVLLFLSMTVGGLNDMSVLTKDYNSTFDVNISLEVAKNIDFKSIINYARSKNFEYAFLIEIYYHSLLMLLEPGETEHLNKLRKLYKMHSGKFTFSEKRTIMHWMIIYCILHTESEGVKYERLIFKLNIIRLKEGLVFYPEEHLHKEIYFQILSVALSIGRIKWAENFIKNYTPKLQPEIQKSMKAMADAYLRFQTKDYEKVLSGMNNVGYADVWDKLYAKSLLARTYYEMKEFNSLLSHIDSSKHFLKTNKSVSELYKKYFANFYYFLGKLISVYEKGGSHLILALKKEILSTKILDNKNWLIEKANELGKIKKY